MLLATLAAWRAELTRGAGPAASLAIQRLLDRVVFLRLCEDRGIVEFGRLRAAAGAADVQAALRRLDVRGGDGTDVASADATIGRIIHCLYDVSGPWRTADTELLGRMYEQFLAEGRAQRKRNGAFYTPAYIVDRVVRETLGPLLAGKSPAEVASLRVIDPACGAGAFLLGVVRYLLDWYLAHYTARRDSAGEVLVRTGEGWALTGAERARILTRHVFGVDIDPHAVEVARSSLLLEMMGGAGGMSELGTNIRVGNALLAQCADIAWDGGFDAVLGNPPYVRIQALPAAEARALAERYVSATRGCDLYVGFVELALRLVREGGQIGLIVPNKFLRADYGEGLRRLLAEARAPRMIIDFGAAQVFAATIYTCILIAAKTPQATVAYGVAEADPTALANVRLRDVPMSTLGAAPWTFHGASEQALIAKLAARSVRLLDLPAAMSRGSSTGDDEVFLVAADSGLEAEALREPLFASDFSRYLFAPAGEWRVIFPYAVEGGRARLLAESEIKKRWPRAYKHLKKHEEALRSRKGFKEWYGYSAARNLEVHSRAQIAVPLLADRPIFAWIPEARRAGLCPMAGGGFTIAVDASAGVDPRFVLGLLNSRLLFWRLQGVSNVFRGGWITCTKQYFGELPIRTIDRADDEEVAAHARIVALVDRALGLQARRVAAATPHERTALDREAAAVDAEIDREVYALHGLTPEEVALVEGAA